MKQNIKTIVVGHKNPDVDSISAAYAYAGLKRSLGMENVISASCGMANRAAQYLFNKFDVPLPKSMRAVYPRVEDIYSKEFISIKEDSSVLAAIVKMNQTRHRRVPVTSEDGEYRGMINMFDLFEGMFDVQVSASRFGRTVRTSVEQIISILRGENLTGIDSSDIKLYDVYVGALSAENLYNRLSKTDCSNVVMVVGDRDNIQKLAIDLNVAVLVVTGGSKVDKTILEKAKESKVSLIFTEFDSATTIRRVRFSTPIFLYKDRCISSFRCTDRLVDIVPYIKKDATDLFSVVNKSNKLIGTFLKRDMDSNHSVNLILVDHNELSQAIDGASEVPIVEILDHHRIGMTPTDKPLRVLNDIVGSSCTLVFEQYKLYRVPISKKVAGVLLGGVITDTVHLKSPTATERDAIAVKELSELAEVSSQELYSELLHAGSIVATQPPNVILNTDRKNYYEYGTSFSICQVEDGSFVSFHHRKDELLEEMKRVFIEEKLDFLGMLVTNVVLGDSLLLTVGKEFLTDDLPYMLTDQKYLFNLPGVLSRKKQLLPELLEFFKGNS